MLISVMYSPLEQFDIVPFFPVLLCNFLCLGELLGGLQGYMFITNSTIYSILSLSFFFFFFYFAIYNKHLYPSTYFEYIGEKIYITFQTIVMQTFLSRKKAENFFPLFIFIFFFILFMNLVGLTPYGFTNTAFIVKPFILSCSILVGITVLGICVQGFHFFEHFVPKDIPKVLIPMVTVVEIISYLSRAFSLAIRLFANMMSGHTLLYILSSFSVKLFKFSIIIGLIPLLLVLAISFLEFGVAFLQSYVFMILMIIYFNEVCPPESDTMEEEKVFDWKFFRRIF